MDNADSSDFTIPSYQSNILSESMLFPSSSSNGSSLRAGSGADLSLSELSLADRPQATRRRPFSLLAQPRNESAVVDEEEEPDQQDGLDQTMKAQDAENVRRDAKKDREEKLQQDLFILKKLNTALEVYKGALRETKSSTELISDRLHNTNALLDKYMGILSNSEQVTKLLLDERWQGAEADEEQVEREYQEELDRRRREAEERALAEQRERDRLEREEKEKREREEKLRLERERAEYAVRTGGRGRGVRGVRGTRAPTRGSRGITGRGVSSTSARGGIPVSTSSGAGRRPSSAASVRSSSSVRGVPRRVQ